MRSTGSVDSIHSKQPDLEKIFFQYSILVASISTASTPAIVSPTLKFL